MVARKQQLSFWSFSWRQKPTTSIKICCFVFKRRTYWIHISQALSYLKKASTEDLGFNESYETKMKKLIRYLVFRIFHSNKNISLTVPSVMPSSINMRNTCSFMRIYGSLTKVWDPNLAIFTEKCHDQGSCLGYHIFMSLQRTGYCQFAAHFVNLAM